MRFVKRDVIAEPKSLTLSNEFAKVKQHFDNKNPGSYKFSAYKADDVKIQLRAVFHDKCAYCESFFGSTAPVDVEHYRPKAAVEEEPRHPGYWWLAMKWDNLLPSCIDCNRKRKQIVPTDIEKDSLEKLLKFGPGRQSSSGKKDSFPVDGSYVMTIDGDLTSERPYLLNPTVDDPRSHLVFLIDKDLPVALVLPKSLNATGTSEIRAASRSALESGPSSTSANVSARGTVSIHVYGLNRLGLLQARTRILRHLYFLVELIVDLQALVTMSGMPEPAKKKLELLTDRIVLEMKAMAAPERPFSELVRAFLEEMKTNIRPEVLDPVR